MVGAFRGTKVMEIVKKHNSGDLVWKRIKLTSTRKPTPRSISIAFGTMNQSRQIPMKKVIALNTLMI
ncbi:hypothetical protein ES319_D02G130200v1 [Gossypium barbadense]|uniref:Uncharacterized protein n=4 Tax=Gossypium TaxID=3633 RepID=A0A5J5SBY8_GOSBA|nr:hypothetical protein ES319_D02G130200v1 [Gossypium barbadense]TYG79434.1 hypothetical protein ES288_D02G138100v1 [Gossypium darwinii]TYG79435.1 hypothetical protein ES288_D02G138100v1 [Gossypium darwinii]